MKVPQAMLDRLAELEQELSEAVGERQRVNGHFERCLLRRDECQLGIKMVEEDPGNAEFMSHLRAVEPREPPMPPRESGVRKRRWAQAVEDAIAAAGAEGTTTADLARCVRLRISRVDAMVANLLQAGKCVVEGDRIMAQQENNTSLFPTAAK